MTGRAGIVLMAAMGAASTALSGVWCWEDGMVPCCNLANPSQPNMGRWCPDPETPDCAWCPDRIVQNPSISATSAVPYPSGYKETYTLTPQTCKWYARYCEGFNCVEYFTPSTSQCSSSKTINHPCDQ